MPERLEDIVEFRGDRLFNGAVNIGWFDSDEARTRAAAEAFVFHGPAYHGVSQDDVGVSHGHRLQDTASFALSLIKRCYGFEDQPFTLAIAGYGTGKSHLGLALSALLNNPKEAVADAVLAGIVRADEAIGAEIKSILNEANQPCLVVALNGMQNFDLTTEITRQILRQIKLAGLATRPLDELRPRFAQARNLIRMAATNTELVNDLLEACDANAIEDILSKLEHQDETIYGQVHSILESMSIKITALGGESIRDVIDVACREYCGNGKPFRSMAIVFDEFGRYTEFATIRSQIAGSGVLQDLFEGVQANAGSVCFAGFIQFDLNAYVQRVAPEHRNEILRYVTRYQSANRVYLSINIETLIASLIEKKLPAAIALRFENDEARYESDRIISNVARWFPQSRHHRLWSDSAQFHSVIRHGCWPLSAYSTWLLFHLAAAGKHLQERSALALLGEVFERFAEYKLEEDSNWTLAPVDFWSESLEHELITSEEGGQQGSISHAYASVFARHGTKIDANLLRLLRAVVLASKTGLKANDKDDAIGALAELAGLHRAVADKGVQQLQDEHNVLEWDESFKEFDILGDAIPRTQFLSVVRQKVASKYDEPKKAALFASKGATWCDLLSDLDCDFAEENKITTREWRYTGLTSNLELIAMHIKLSADKWLEAKAVDEPRGTIIYCYVEPNRDVDVIKADIRKLASARAKEMGFPALPILVVLLHDTEGVIGQSLAELAVLEDSISADDRVRFGNLIPSHREKTLSVVRGQVESMMKQRHYVTSYKESLSSNRLVPAGTELFSRIFENVITFPFDGFATPRGNAADSCQELTIELLRGALDWGSIIAKPAKNKNRAITVLKDAWDVFNQNGQVSTRPGHRVIRSLAAKWDEMLTTGERRIALDTALQQLFEPPYGANVASAGLFLGVFVAARNNKLIVVRADQQYALTEWISDGLFRGKFVDVRALRDVNLVFYGEESSEWESLLDEWEQAESHLQWKDCLQRARELNSRIPLPQNYEYRRIHLEDQSLKSIEALARMERQQEAALRKTESGLRNDILNDAIWGASELTELMNKMIREKTLWSEHQIQDLQPSIENTRQLIIQGFSEWLEKQTPRNRTPDAVGDFKHKMIHLTGANLRKIGLDELFEQLEKRTLAVIKKSETAAEARQVLTEVENWLTAHGDATRFARVQQIRELRQVGKDFTAKLQDLNARIPMKELSDMRNRLSKMLEDIKAIEEGLLKRASALWESKLGSPNDLEDLIDEVNNLRGVFEYCEQDLEDLEIMRQVLVYYQDVYRQLEDQRLTWEEFDSLGKKLLSDAQQKLGEEEVPWPPEEAISELIVTVSKRREAASKSWIELLENDAADVNTLAVSEANRLHERATNAPEFLVEGDSLRQEKTVSKIEERLNELKIEWLIEKFRELPTTLRQHFLERVRSNGST